MTHPSDRGKGNTMAGRAGTLLGADDAGPSADRADGAVTRGAISPGQQLISQQFGRERRHQALGAHGDRTAISIGLADPECVAGSIEQGAWVAIFVSEHPEPYLAGGSTRRLPPLTRILLPKVQVLGVCAPTEDVQAAERAPRIQLTIAVTQTEAEKLICGSRNGDLTFALRGDRSQVVNRPVSTGRDISPALYGSAS